MKIIYFILVFFHCVLLTQAINIRGRIIHSESSEPISYATVVVLGTDSIFVSGTQSDEKGRFLLQNIFPSENLRLKVSCIGFNDCYTSLVHLDRDMDIGDIFLSPTTTELQEVTVSADRIIRQPNRQIVLPTIKQKEISDNGIDFLFNMNMRGVQIDPVHQTISKLGGGELQIRVNGRKIEMQELVAIRPSEVLRIDYYDEPGIRFADDQTISGIIDIILKQQNSGGFIALDGTNAVITGFSNDQISARFNHKRSEFSFLYKLNYRSYKERHVDQEDVYHYPEETSTRSMNGVNAPFGYTDHTLNVGYNYKNGNNTQLNVVFSNAINNRHYTELYNISFLNTSLKTNSEETYKSHFYAPSLDLYFKQQMDAEQNLYVNLVGTYMNSDMKRNYWNLSGKDTISFIQDFINGDRYSFIGEAIYEKKINNSGLQIGFKYSQSHTNNKYIQSEWTTTLMDQSNAYLFAEWNGNIKHFAYSVGIGGSRIWFKEGEEKSISYVFQPLVRLGYSFNDRWGIKYVFRIRPTIPSLANLNDVLRKIDDFAEKQGNPRLKTFQTYANSLDVYYENDQLSAGITTRYSYASKPIMEEIRYDKSSRYFVYTVDNQKNQKELNIQAEGAWYFPKNWGSINVVAGYSNYESRGNTYVHSLNDFYLHVQLQLLYKEFGLSVASMLSRFEELEGESIEWDEKNTEVILKYKHKSLSLGIGILNPFGGNSWKTASRNLSSEVATFSRTYIDDNTNMLFVNLSYNFSFGRKYTSIRKKMHNKDRESGIMEIK